MPPRPVPGPVPWSRAELERIVEEACEYIGRCKLAHARSLGLAIGEYLYLHLYRMDDAYLTSRNPGKDASLRDIAARTGYDRTTLRTWVIAAATRIRLDEMGFRGEELDLTHFAALYRLRQHPRLVLELAAWAERERVPPKLLKRWASLWASVIEEGGDLGDLRREPHEPRKRGKGRKRRAPSTPDELRVIRVLEMVLRWVEKTRFSPARRATLLSSLREIGTLLAAKGG